MRHRIQGASSARFSSTFADMSTSSMTEQGVAEARRVAVASALGTTIERYDFFIYGTAAAVVFGPQFFPQVSERAATLAAFATFAVGFIERPLGGIVMGQFGDRLGRKSMLVWSLMLMGLSTFGIGLLPNYAQLGLWAPALLITLRFVQGFALGGEWGGAVLMSVEHAPQAVEASLEASSHLDLRLALSCRTSCFSSRRASSRLTSSRPGPGGYHSSQAACWCWWGFSYAWASPKARCSRRS
jgi:Sugar (and other) transporter